MIHQRVGTEHLFLDRISVDNLFSGLDQHVRKELTSIERPLRFLPNEIVFATGDQPRFIYIHRQGRVAHFQQDGIREIIFACPVVADRFYGLIEVLSGNTFNASMKTLTDNEFEVIHRDEFLAFIQEQPVLCFRLAEIISRLYQTALLTLKSH